MSASRTIAPRGNAAVGILGGGQLGRMLALAGRNMGYRIVTLDPTPDAPCGQVADRQIVAGYDDAEAARELARASDVITYEFENVDSDVAAMLAKESYVPQGSELLYTTQHRLREKQAIEAAGAPVAPYKEIKTEQELHQAARDLGLPLVLKTVTGGYDGKGQRVIRSADQVAPSFEALGGGSVPLVAEQFITYTCEISVIAARNPDGATRTFPAAENVHVHNILHLSIVPARVPQEVLQEAERLAVRIAESLGVVGLIAVEMFVTQEGKLLINELAPRPHNSGHYTMDACAVSQFEQHLRAICNLPLPVPKLHTEAVMANLLGEHMEPFLQWFGSKGERELPEGLTLKLHLYGKHEAKTGRKMGHVNVLGDIGKALEWIEQSGIWTSPTKEDTEK